MIIKPVKNRVYIELEPMEEKVGSIYIPDQHSERTRTAHVVAIGEEAKYVKPGDKVVLFWSTGSRLHLVGSGLNEDLHRIVMDYEILAILE